MNFFIYIIYSPSVDQFYVGQTIDLIERINQHNNAFFENSSTKKGIPWEIYFKLECSTRNQAILIENHIKRMKSRKYYSSLLLYPEISEKLLLRFL
ncbi:GIY-YIG nuclease family protein [Pedobacter cryophilus]